MCAGSCVDLNVHNKLDRLDERNNYWEGGDE